MHRLSGESRGVRAQFPTEADLTPGDNQTEAEPWKMG